MTGPAGLDSGVVCVIDVRMREVNCGCPTLCAARCTRQTMPALEFTDVVPDEPLRHDPTFRRAVLAAGGLLVLIFLALYVIIHSRLRRTVRAVRSSALAAWAARAAAPKGD
jgi:hypothetical protein